MLTLEELLFKRATGRQGSKGLYLLIHETYISWHNVDTLMTGLCLPLDLSSKCFSVYMKQVRALNYLLIWYI